MSTTPVIGATELEANETNPHVRVNEALRRLEAAFVRVLSRSNSGPPGSPSNGDAYIVDSATGDWSGFSVDDIAYRVGGGWESISAVEGLRLWVNDEDVTVAFDGTSWVAEAAASEYVSVVSVGSTSHTLTASDRNKLILFNSASACTLTLPENASEALQAGLVASFRNNGGGQVSLATEGSDTLVGAGSSTNDSEKVGQVLLEISGSPNRWVSIGDLS